jgi:hypothetical protein
MNALAKVRNLIGKFYFFLEIFIAGVKKDGIPAVAGFCSLLQSCCRCWGRGCYPLVPGYWLSTTPASSNGIPGKYLNSFRTQPL